MEPGMRRPAATRTREEGALIISVMMFVLVFLGMGVALSYLVFASTGSTELERKEVKAFNIAEAGLDASMLALKMNWPETAASPAAVNEAAIRAEFPANQFRDPTRSPASDFINIEIFDNSSGSLPYDANADGKLYIQSEANVDDDRHRISVLVERHTWSIFLPSMALFAERAGGNAHGLRVHVDSTPQTSPLPPGGVPARWASDTLSGVEPGSGVAVDRGTASQFSNWVDAALLTTLKGIAHADGTLFSGYSPLPDGARPLSQAQAFLTSPQAWGKIIYVESATGISFAGNTQIGSYDKPVVLVLDNASGQNVLDFRGSANFYGVVISLGELDMRGTSGFYGSVLCRGDLVSSGMGSIPEINYNQDIINLLSRIHTISVNIVPNTWEEHTPPKASP
jgi:hypothetical protein